MCNTCIEEGMQDRMNIERKLKREDQRKWQSWILLVVELGMVGSALQDCSEWRAGLVGIKAEGKASRQ